jgi:phosphoribosylamine--glycine ligase
MAARGYPTAPRSGDLITGLADVADDDADSDAVKVFHAGTALRNGSVITKGGRVLCVTALGDSTRQAQQHAYDAVRRISFAGAQWRTDIGQRAVRR